MSFFQRPGDSSSEEESSDDDVDRSLSTTDLSRASAESDIAGGVDAVVHETDTEPLSLTNTISNDGVDIDESRSIMIASMLEELTKYRAQELLNASNNGSPLDRTSPQVTEFAKDLFVRSSSILQQTGIMSPEAASDSKVFVRGQYLSALERASYGATTDNVSRRASVERGRIDSASASSAALIRRTSRQPAAFQASAAGQLQQLTWEMNNLQIVRRPSDDLQVSTIPTHLSLRSHYQSSFEERGSLGKGGFGSVRRAYNIYDEREYAVKKIPLSAKLSQTYSRGSLTELSYVLREVQALARLDHCNIVRYHATWIEEPISPALPYTRSGGVPLLFNQPPLLLDNKPAFSDSATDQHKVYEIEAAQDHVVSQDSDSPRRTGNSNGADFLDRNNDSFDPFNRSGQPSTNIQELWSQHGAISNRPENFDHGHGQDHQHLHSNISEAIEQPGTYVLHIQMSMYPLSLSDYLIGGTSSRDHELPIARHCFHLMPSLQLLLGILCGLQYMHAQGYVHRDLKPTNIFLARSEVSNPWTTGAAQGFADVGSCPSCLTSEPRLLNPRIGDLGLVADLEEAAGTGSSAPTANGSGSAIGTRYYRPPSNEKDVIIVDEKIDVFALGVIFLELLVPCQTRMERINLLKNCQTGDVHQELTYQVLAEGHSQEVVDMVEACVFGMIDPNARTRWQCAMIKSAAETIRDRITELRPIEEPD